MNADLLKTIFTYFAKFPEKAGVLKNFTKGTSGLYAGYDTLKSDITALAPHSLVPGITDFVFGSDMTSVIKRIEQISGIYLFVDYGNIYDYLLEPMKSETGEFVIAITVARKIQPDDIDAIEQLLLGDITLGMLTQIKDLARQDSNQNIFLKYLTFPNDFSPWFARDLFNSTGWTMTFKVKGAQLV
jgi:hypothetical protein